MLLTRSEGNLKMEFNYNPELVDKIKKIPGGRFHKDPLSNYWTFPSNAIRYARTNQIISEGFMYPYLKSAINPDTFHRLRIEVKSDRIKAEGSNVQMEWLWRCMSDLASYEEKSEENDGYELKSLANLEYYKNGIMVISFPKGLIYRVNGFLDVFRFQSIIRHPEPTAPTKTLDLELHNFTPRPYQMEAWEKIRTKNISNRGTLCMATGSGKTSLSAMITANLGVPTIFYTQSKDLLEQTATVYEELLGQEIGRICGNKFSIKPITIATTLTVFKAWERQDAKWDKLNTYFKEVGLMFVDEGHGLGADTIFKVAELTDAYYSYALTATPDREDGKKIFIEAGTGPEVELIAESVLVEGGYVLPVEVELCPVQHFKSRKKRYNKLYETEIIDHWERNRKIVKAIRDHAGKQVLVLVKEIDHGKKLAEVLNVPFIHGSSKQAERKAVIDQFRNREIDILVASNILKQGIDLPEAEVLVLAHGGTSLVELMQKVGRVRRPSPNKTKGIVVDFYDKILPENENDMFRAQSERRIAFYKSKNFSISVKNL